MTPTILVIVGISGDLAKRKLLPAIGEIAAAGVLPDKFRVVGVTRRDDVRLENLTGSTKNREFLHEHGELFHMNLTEKADYQRLASHLLKIEKSFGTQAQRLFYLSVPPQVSQSIIEQLGTSGLAKAPNTKLLLEKPFGTDLASATELVQHIDQHFNSEQVYRIDHYLAKEMAQNLIVFRERNSLFKRTWNKEFIERLEIIASETLGIEGRATFYEQTGALRDVVQSHLLQLAALVLMKTPHAEKLAEVPNHRLAALQKLHAPAGDVKSYAVRGQYATYQKEVSNPHSTVETFVSLTLESEDPRWEGVPITLIAGKALDIKTTEIRITYRKEHEYESNLLVLRLQPNEGVEIGLWTKKPGYEQQIEPHLLRFAYKDHFSVLPEAYEQVFLDAMRGDHTLFTTSEEVLETWRILQPVQEAWAMSDEPLQTYELGTKAGDIT
jgi:glucose-6-phosphate 1-dehydrogenase